jgi:hypothetical protein
MAEIRISKSQPQGPAFTKSQPATKGKSQPAGLSAAQASKVTKSQPAGPTKSPMMVGDTKGKCQVIIKSTGLQCENPANYQWAPASRTTCRTHYNRLIGGSTFKFVATKVAYNASLWGAPATTTTTKSTTTKGKVTGASQKPAKVTKGKSDTKSQPASQSQPEPVLEAPTAS